MAIRDRNKQTRATKPAAVDADVTVCTAEVVADEAVTEQLIADVAAVAVNGKTVIEVTMEHLAGMFQGSLPPEELAVIMEQSEKAAQSAFSDLMEKCGGAVPTEAQVAEFEKNLTQGLTEALRPTEPVIAETSDNTVSVPIESISQFEKDFLEDLANRLGTNGVDIDVSSAHHNVDEETCVLTDQNRVEEPVTVASSQAPQAQETASQTVLRMLAEKPYPERIRTGIENRKKMGFFQKLFS